MTEEKTEGNVTDLTIQDLNALRQIIDVASQRGAFKPGEMAQVGATYNKLDAFLDEIARQQKAAKSSQETTNDLENSEVTDEPPQGA